MSRYIKIDGCWDPDTTGRCFYLDSDVDAFKHLYYYCRLNEFKIQDLAAIPDLCPLPVLEKEGK